MWLYECGAAVVDKDDFHHSIIMNAAFYVKAFQEPGARQDGGGVS